MNDGDDEIGRKIKDRSLLNLIEAICTLVPSNIHVLINSRYKVLGLEEVLTYVSVGRLSWPETYRFSFHNPGFQQIPYEYWKEIYEQLGGHPRSFELLSKLVFNKVNLSSDELEKYIQLIKENLQHEFTSRADLP